jgi:uncharacterized protein (TIGR00730 family)
MKRICVFAGSNPGNKPEYLNAARALGEALVARGLQLVYGGSSVGLMGALADTVLRQGGHVIGVMPSGLFRGEIVHRQCTEFYEVASMHERKAKMGELADAFIALPGGYGTFEEIFEVVSWSQIGIHQKPIGVLNVEGYYEPVMKMIGQGVDAGFIPSAHANILLCETDPAALLDALQSYRPPKKTNKWSELPEKEDIG